MSNSQADRLAEQIKAEINFLHSTLNCRGGILRATLEAVDTLAALAKQQASPEAQEVCKHGIRHPHECSACADEPSDAEIAAWMRRQGVAGRAEENTNEDFLQDVYEQCCNAIKPYVNSGYLPCSVVESLQMLLERFGPALATPPSAPQVPAVAQAVASGADWTECPVCGEPDMRRVMVDGQPLINCTNHACASNGGSNSTAMRAPSQVGDKVDAATPQCEQAALPGVRDALAALVEKLDAISAHPGYTAVFTSAFAHGVLYKGPNWKIELEVARAALSQGTSQAAANGGKTGSPPGLLQDDCRGLSKALASKPNARQEVREVCAEIRAAATGGAVYVCPEKDIVCGHRPANWCASCPLRNKASHQEKTNG